MFVHGLGTSAKDMVPLARAFEEVGIAAVCVELDGHDGKVESLEGVTVEAWLDQVRAAVREAKEKHDEVYLVGFSLGATLSLRVAREMKVDGVLCLSTFIEPPKPALLVRLALLAPTLPWIGRRRPRVSALRTRGELDYTKRLPSKTVSMVLDQAPELAQVSVDCPVLLVHSVDDPVASYRAVAATVTRVASDRVRLVTLSRLKHFIQFDIPTTALRDLALAHFRQESSTPDYADPMWLENVKQREDEVRHWANALSLLFFGFFTVFGALAKSTLPDVADHDPSAPYLLFTYALVIAAYLQFAILNLFYMNRTQAYIRTYVDPVQTGGVGWTFYRTGGRVAGRASVSMTRFLAVSVGLVPMLAATASVVYALIEFHGKIFSLSGDNIWLAVIAFVAVAWLVVVAYASLTLHRYTRTFLYLVPAVVPASPRFLAALRLVYATTAPGTVGRLGKDRPIRERLIGRVTASRGTGRARPALGGEVAD